jgi:hypothetical protein
MNNKIQTAVDNFKTRRGICSQSVLRAFCGSYGMDEDLAQRVACGFGSGNL